MASGDQRNSMASPFDELLKQSRDSFEKLAGGTGSDQSRSTELPVEQSEQMAAEHEQLEGVPIIEPRHQDVHQFLNDRFGNRWRHEIVERRRERNRVIVLCKLTIEDTGASKSQFGQATIESGRASTKTETGALAGKVTGVAFSYQPAAAGNGDGVDAEEAAYRRAADAALARCAEML